MSLMVSECPDGLPEQREQLSAKQSAAIQKRLLH
jgi:hypothetical protein